MTTNLKQKATAVFLALVMVGLAAGTSWAQGQIARVGAYGSESWRVWGNAGDTITVTVDGDGDTDLDLYVLDGNGRVIVSDEDATDYCVVRFTVTRSGYFTVKVRNLGSVYNEYRISTSIR
jgi:hypothetical protein